MHLCLPPQYDNHDFNGHVLNDEDNQNVSAAIQFGHLIVGMGVQCC